MKIKYLFFLWLFTYCIAGQVQAQKKTPQYTIYDAPIEVDWSLISKINSAIAPLVNEEQVFDLIDNQLIRYHNLKIFVLHRLNKDREEHIEYAIGAAKNMVRHIVSLHATKGAPPQAQLAPDQLQGYLTRAIWVIDTLKLSIAGRTGANYMLRVDRPGLASLVIPIPKTTGKYAIYLTPALAKLSQPLNATLTDDRTTGTRLATFQLSFLNKSQKEHLRSWQATLTTLNDEQPDFEELVNNLTDYCRLAWGYTPADHIKDWLFKKNQND